MLPDPGGGLAALYELLTNHRLTPCLATFIIHQLPRAILVGVFGALVLAGRWIVLFHSFRQIACGAHIEPASGIPQNIYPEWTSCDFQTPRVGLEPTT